MRENASRYLLLMRIFLLNRSKSCWSRWSSVFFVLHWRSNKKSHSDILDLIDEAFVLYVEITLRLCFFLFTKKVKSLISSSPDRHVQLPLLILWLYLTILYIWSHSCWYSERRDDDNKPVFFFTATSWYSNFFLLLLLRAVLVLNFIFF